MKVLLTSAIIVACIVTMSCNKNSSGPNAGAGPNSLFPLTQGSTWYYQDSAFTADSTSSVLNTAYSDTMTVTKNTYTDSYGNVYLEVSDIYGWFDGSYISVDPSNDGIIEADSPYFEPYTAFAVAQSDNQIIQQNGGQYNPNNSACPLTSTLYGYVTPVTIGTFTNCLTNILLTTDCNSVPLEQIDTYVQPGTGVVRIEDDEADSTLTGGVTLYKSYTQTLTSATIVK